MAETGTTKKGVYAFIDGQNLHQSIIEQGWKLDHRRFRKYLSDKLGVSRAFYFLGRLPSQSRLYDNLRNSGYILTFKKTFGNKRLFLSELRNKLEYHPKK